MCTQCAILAVLAAVNFRSSPAKAMSTLDTPAHHA
jgi:hypothetical protein